MLGHFAISSEPFLINAPDEIPEPPPEPVIEARVTQTAVLILQESFADIRVTQTAILYLEPPVSGIQLTQTAILIATRETPCLTRRAQLWKITRQDGEVLAYTTHDEPIIFQGVTYQPCDSLYTTATSGGMVSGGVGDSEIRGVISGDGITARDLAGGLYDGAIVEVWVQTWDASTEPGFLPFRIAKGVLGKISQGDAAYTAELLTPGVRLQQRPLLSQYTPACRWELGDGRCPVDLGALTVTSTVTAVGARDAYNRFRHRVFFDSARTEAAEFFDNGSLTWTSGANAGLSSEVKNFAAGWITLWSPMPHEIEPGDAYTLAPGCNKTRDDHTIKFGLDMLDFGGFPDIPGTDSLTETPDAK
jgi:uncharacterized phage protein (TIGR02218 family)